MYVSQVVTKFSHFSINAQFVKKNQGNFISAFQNTINTFACLMLGAYIEKSIGL